MFSNIYKYYFYQVFLIKKDSLLGGNKMKIVKIVKKYGSSLVIVLDNETRKILGIEGPGDLVEVRKCSKKGEKDETKED